MRNIAFKITDNLHMEFKIAAAKQGRTIKDYIIELIKSELETKNVPPADPN